MRNTRNTFIFFITILCSFPVYGSWQYTISNYSKKEYNAANQSWQICQQPNGWMYIANNSGLLEFDGVYWNLYSFGNKKKMRSVAAGNDNRVYGGGMEEFGYFVPNTKGELDYNSLSRELPPEIRIGVIWEIHSTEEGTFFVSNNAAFLFREDSLSIAVNNQSINCSTYANNKLYMHTNQGLMTLDKGQLSVLPGTASIRDLKVVALVPTEKGILVVSSRNGLYFYDNGVLTAYEGRANDLIRNNQLFCATNNGDYIGLGTVQNGILIWDIQTDAIKQISVENGLQNNTVLRACFDKDANLWMGLDNGIDCVHLNYPVLSLGKSSAIGTGYSAIFKDNYLYLGTNQGLYYAETEDLGIERDFDIHLMKGTEGQVWSVRNISGGVFCNSDNGVYVLNGNQADKIAGTWGTWNVVPADQEGNTLIAGTYAGMYTLKKRNGKWVYGNWVNGINQSCKMIMTEDARNTLWVANSENGIFRIKLTEDLRKAENVKNYNTPSLPVDGNTYITRINSDITFATSKGLFRYNQLRDSLERFHELEELLDGSTNYSYILQDEQHRIWYVTNGVLKLIRYNFNEKKYEKNNSEPYISNSLIVDFEDMYPYSQDEVLIGTEDGFSLIRTNQNENRDIALNLQIRKIFNTNFQDSLLYSNSFIEQSERIVLPYSRNSIRIEYGAGMAEPQHTIMYSCRLLGHSQEDWSEFSRHTGKEYTHLQEGNYVFEVRCRSVGNESTPIASFNFRILPPWYRNTWAYIAYLSLFFLLLYAAWYHIQQKRKLLILKQQQEILHRELAFKREAEQKEKEIDLLKQENLKAELQYKTDELVNSTLNLIRKNDMLLDIKKEVMAIRQAITDNNPENIRRRSILLINKIDTNMEQDKMLQSFQDNFDVLHRNFFMALEERFPGLSKKEKLLCVYVKMNMITKEIAPLMNMSVRGVEITRYRLRKKLNLEQSENLYEFLQQISK
jgi:Predicted periplasmic ligand-binding sensor domain